MKECLHVVYYKYSSTKSDNSSHSPLLLLSSSENSPKCLCTSAALNVAKENQIWIIIIDEIPIWDLKNSPNTNDVGVHQQPNAL